MQPAMIEKQIKIEVFAIDNHPLLTRNKCEAIAQLDDKLL